MPDDWNIWKSWLVDSRLKGITVGSNQHIYFTTFYGVWKLKTNSDTQPECIFESTDDPEGIVFHDNTLYICDSCEDSNRIIQYNTKTDSVCILLDDCGCHEALITDDSITDPHCITTNTLGDMYFTEDSTVRKINLRKRLAETIAGTGSDLADGEASKVKFSNPRGIAVGEDGTTYVCENFGCRIRQIKGDIVSTIAGQLRNDTSRDGTLKEATFNRPLHIAVDVDGSLVVAEKNSLRRIDLVRGVVTTLRGLSVLNNISSMTLDKCSGAIYVGTSGNQIFKIVKDTFVWYERYVWIGHLKEDASYCHFKRIPSEIVKEITHYIRLS